jgi:hypothetical protein
MTTWGRTLGPNDDVTIPGAIICVEVATVSEVDQVNPRNRIHRLRCGVAIAGRMENGKWTRENVCNFTSSPQLWEFINCRRASGKPVWLFSGNLSTMLTLTGFWRMLESGWWALAKKSAVDPAKIRSEKLRRQLLKTQTGVLVEADPPTCLMAWHRDGWKMIALDLRNYWDKPMEQLASLLAIPTVPSPQPDDPAEVWTDHAERLARITQQCVVRLAGWHLRNQMGRFGWTVAGMALAGFRHRYMRHKIELPPSQSDRDFERRAYFNGRCEPLWLGEVRGNRYYPPEGLPATPGLFDRIPRGPFSLVDSRSFYGGVAALQELPINCVGEGEGFPPGQFLPFNLDQGYLAEVQIVSERHEFPCRLPDRTVYAVGDFWTVLCGPELLRAVETNSVRAVGHWRAYNLDRPFREYALGLWGERMEAEKNGDLLLSSLIKALLARLHGKFMQRDFKWSVNPREIAPAPWHRWTTLNATTGERKDFRSIAWEVQQQRPAGDAKHCFPALAAFVTAWGREWLRSWMQIAGAREVLYVSTDSLIVTQTGRENLERIGIIGDYGIGACRVVETSDRVRISGPNDYEIGGRVCFAGLPFGCVERGGTTATYSTRPSLRAILGSPPTESLTETTQTARLAPSSETWRMSAGGWLDKIILAQGETRWELSPSDDQI